MMDRVRRYIYAKSASEAGFKRLVVLVASILRYDLTHLTRVVYHKQCREFIRKLDSNNLDVMEVSAGQAWNKIPFRSYIATKYPEFDICADVLENKFDLIIADQVFEHLLWPYKAARNVLHMLKPGGYFMIMTPFLIRIHDGPNDCSRWTETGLKYFLAECGFELETTTTGSWGNKAAVKSNLVTWSRVGWRRQFRNEERYPISVWAIARKPALAAVDAPRERS